MSPALPARLRFPIGVRVAVIATVLAAGSARAQNDTWALTNARIETVTRGVIPRGTIVIRDGLIQAVGADVKAPSDARVVDLANRTVYPGLIDLTSSLGLPTPPTQQGGPFAVTQSSAATATNVGLEPGRMIAEELRPSAADVRGIRDAGITTVLVAPSRGAFRGLSALVPLRDDSATRFVVRSPVALHMGFQGVSGRYPATLLGVIAYERQKLYDAQRHAMLLDRYRAGARSMARPSYDPHLDALVPVVRGSTPVFFAANGQNEIRRALRIGREFDIPVTVVGGTEAFLAVDALKGGRPPVLSVDFPNSTGVSRWSYRSSQRREPNDSARADSAVRKLVEGNAAALHRAGIRFALASGSLKPAEFLGNVRKVIAAGLPRDVALEALTIRAAEIAGAGQQLGSIEAGKIANLVVTEGDLLGDSAKVRLVFVDGVRYEVLPPAPGQTAGGARGGRGRPGQQTPDAPAASTSAVSDASTATGSWTVSFNNPRLPGRATLTITQNGDVIDGSMRLESGTVAISDGRVTGRSVVWTVTAPIEGQTAALVFRGTLEGTRMSGTVQIGAQGTGTFTAEKTP